MRSLKPVEAQLAIMLPHSSNRDFDFILATMTRIASVTIQRTAAGRSMFKAIVRQIRSSASGSNIRPPSFNATRCTPSGAFGISNPCQQPLLLISGNLSKSTKHGRSTSSKQSRNIRSATTCTCFPMKGSFCCHPANETPLKCSDHILWTSCHKPSASSTSRHAAMCCWREPGASQLRIISNVPVSVFQWRQKVQVSSLKCFQPASFAGRPQDA
mmetsp:Transcript_21295/g.47893  ORF Transcript_21295/g.47893 Transcript_21295/m.47893 type:complete len:214 (+) Transcript_21295:40-681(+)